MRPALQSRAGAVRQIRDVTLELAAARKKSRQSPLPVQAAAPRAMGGYSLQAPGPARNRAAQKQVHPPARYLPAAGRRGLRGSRRYREHARILESVDRLRLEAMDETFPLGGTVAG